jgi:hypothetical protein
MRAAACALALTGLLAACGADPAADPAQGGSTSAPVDSALVELLVELHLADARAAVAPDAQAPRRRAEALRRHGVSEADLAARLADLAERPEAASATYLATETRLQMERQGATP